MEHTRQNLTCFIKLKAMMRTAVSSLDFEPGLMRSLSAPATILLGFMLALEAVGAVQYSESITRQVTGQNIDEFQENLSVSVNIEGSYLFFSGSLSAEFSQNSLTQSESEFSRIQQSITPWALTLTIDSETRGLLNKTFRDELDGLDASNEDACKSFFTKYGSHILTGIAMGGRALQTASTDKYKMDSSYSLDVVAKAAYDGLVGKLSAEAKTKYESAISSFTANSNILSTTTGGDPALGQNLFNGEISVLEEWSKSVVGAPVFVDFTANNPLVPIWQLCADDAQGMKVRSGLSTYYTDHWAPDNANIHRVYPDYIDAIRLVEGTAPSGYAKLEPDITLIRSFEKFSLFYHKTKYTATGTNKSAVTDIIAYRILDLDPPEGYTYMAITFGSLTELTRLCYKTGEYDPATAIIELAWGWNGPLGNHEPPPSFTKINRSLGECGHIALSHHLATL
ncbi:MAC/Perforin domain-containing protein [Ustulina deusta]|nr:MAC/Perforin domain-containing protein [Ustulina deusta]